MPPHYRPLPAIFPALVTHARVAPVANANNCKSHNVFFGAAEAGYPRTLSGHPLAGTPADSLLQNDLE
jgi:hypothetical protein